MMKKFLCSIWVALIAIMTAATIFAQDMGVITGNAKGTYYQFGLNLAELVKPRGIKLNVYDSVGSVQNVYSVYKTPGIQLGIVQSDVLAFISKVHTDPVLKRIADKIKLVFPLYNEEIHVLAHREIRDFDDLADRVVAVGEEGSGTNLTARLLFEVSDVKPREMVPVGTGEALAQLKQGKIDAMFYVAGLPVKLFVEDVASADGLALVPITNKSVLEFYPGIQIPPNTYAWQGQQVDTVAVKAVLVSFDFRGLNCDNVGKFAKIFQENMEWLVANGHPKWKAVDLNAAVKGWNQYDCVRKIIKRPQQTASPVATDPNPVLDAIKKMFAE